LHFGENKKRREKVNHIHTNVDNLGVAILDTASQGTKYEFFALSF